MQNTKLIIGLVLFAGISRLIPHPWNFTAVTAMAVLASHKLDNRWLAALLPVLTLFWTDLFLGFHSTALFVYLGVLIPVLLPKSTHYLTKLVTGSLGFFILTNFGVWWAQGLYPLTFEGLIQCFTMALPFYENQILGDVVYSAVLLGAFYGLKNLSFLKNA
ncbi:MAG: DUF6580 family putative transport protein [Bdellovibrionales bacterium]